MELYLRDPTVGTYAPYSSGTKHEERLLKYVQTGDTQLLLKKKHLQKMLNS